MSDELQVDEAAEVEVMFASPINGYERGAREVLTRTPELENLIRAGHVRVVREVGAPPAALVGVPAPEPELVPEGDVAPEPDTEPESKPESTRRGRGGAR